MNTTAYPDYEHTQNGPWYLFLFGLAAISLSVGWVAPPDPAAAVMLPVVALSDHAAGRIVPLPDRCR